MQPDEIDLAWSNNPDGAGFSYVSPSGKLEVYRTLELKKLHRAYYRALNDGMLDTGHAVHFRYATHGLKTIVNVHPLRVNKTTVVIHNGVLPVPYEAKRSDTAVFAEDYLAALPPTWFDDAALFDLVESYTVGSKLVVVTNHQKRNHDFYIVNEPSGHWDSDGRWFSNSSYRPYQRTLTIGSKTNRLCELCSHGLLVVDYERSTVYCEACDTCQNCYDDHATCGCGSKVAIDCEWKASDRA